MLSKHDTLEPKVVAEAEARDMVTEKLDCLKTGYV